MNDFTINPPETHLHAVPMAPSADDTPGVAQAAQTKSTPRLQTLARHGMQAGLRAREIGRAAWADDLAHLSEERKAAWCRIISSASTAETLEDQLIKPMVQAKQGELEILEYLESHAEDERRHHELMNCYLKNTFGYEKKKKTLSNRLIYDRLIPGIASTFRHKPLYGFALLYCYERFSVSFYSRIYAEAQADGAQNLLTLLQTIEKDELRHIAGMEYLLKEEIRLQGGLKMGDLSAVSAILAVMVLDFDMRPWAVHNREVRGHLRRLGVDTDELTANARRMRDATLEIMVLADEGVRNAANH